MAVKVGINGFGRIGRNVFRAALNNPEVEVVAVNDLTDANMLAHLLQYDSVHGKLDAEVKVDGDNLVVNGKTIEVSAERDPAKLSWGKQGVEIVVESTGFFTKRADAAKHLEAGAKKLSSLHLLTKKISQSLWVLTKTNTMRLTTMLSLTHLAQQTALRRLQKYLTTNSASNAV